MQVTCMPTYVYYHLMRLKHPQSLDNDIDRNAFHLDKHIFTGYMHSQELCDDIWLTWWIGYIEARDRYGTQEIKGRMSYKLKQLFKFIGPPELYVDGPIQSILARPGTGAIDAEYSDSWLDDSPYCSTGCEDRRLATELWIALTVNNGQGRPASSVRDRGPVKMKCPDGFIARPDHVLNIRERWDERGLEIMRRIKEIDDTFDGDRSFNSQWLRNEYVQEVVQCKCVENPKKRQPIEVLVQCFDVEPTFENIMGFTRDWTQDDLPDTGIDTTLQDALDQWSGWGHTLSSVSILVSMVPLTGAYAKSAGYSKRISSIRV